jgi:hypothetical protein
MIVMVFYHWIWIKRHSVVKIGKVQKLSAKSYNYKDHSLNIKKKREKGSVDNGLF